MKIRKHILLWGILVILLGGQTVSAQENAGEKEYALKADFLNRFVDYVYWKNYSKKQTFKIAVLEQSPLDATILSVATLSAALELLQHDLQCLN